MNKFELKRVSVIWGIIIVTSACYVRPLYNFLLLYVSREVVSATVAVLLVLFTSYCAGIFVKKSSLYSAKDIFLLILSGLILAGLFFYLELPEEKIHILLFGSLGVIRTFEQYKDNSLIRVFVFVFMFSLASELFQAILPDRFCDIRDLLIDTSSGMSAAVIAKILLR